MENFYFSYLMDYIPKRYEVDYQGQQNRQTVYDFKNGICPISLCEQFLSKIKLMFSQCVVCFIPASTQERTKSRYSLLSSYIKRNAPSGITVSTDALTAINDVTPMHMGGDRVDNPAKNYIVNTSVIKGKNIVLIDDVITTGNSFKSTAQKLINNGALSVTGLFLAKTKKMGY